MMDNVGDFCDRQPHELMWEEDTESMSYSMTPRNWPAGWGYIVVKFVSGWRVFISGCLKGPLNNKKQFSHKIIPLAGTYATKRQAQESCESDIHKRRAEFFGGLHKDTPL